MKANRDTLLRTATSHAMWPRTQRRPEDMRYVRNDVVCSCGFELRDIDWIDDVVRSQLDQTEHRPVYVIAYPEETPEQSLGGVQLVEGHGSTALEHRDLEWLLTHPDLPEEFRRAAAVHLGRSE